MTAALAHTQKIAGRPTHLENYLQKVFHSEVFRALDHACLPIMADKRHPTFPNAVIEMTEPLYLSVRRDFVSIFLGRSETLKHHFDQYPYQGMTKGLVDQPSAAWVLRRAFRRLDQEGQETLISRLGQDLPNNAPTQLQRMLEDYRAQPVIGADVSVKEIRVPK